MARTPQGPPPPPPVQRLRVRYAKRGRLRFSSHRDFQRALERALRRAGVPMAYSAGFNPHPRISYANAAPTGAASEAEYLEIALADRVDPHQLRTDLDAALPPGLDILDVVEAGHGALADRLEASLWQVAFGGLQFGDPRLHEAVSAFLSAPEVQVERMTKNGRRVFDARGAVVRAEMAVEESSSLSFCAILHLVVRHSTPAVRPDDVLTALSAVADFAPPSPPVVTRLAQGPLLEEAGSVADPFAAEMGTGGAELGAPRHPAEGAAQA